MFCVPVFHLSSIYCIYYIVFFLWHFCYWRPLLHNVLCTVGIRYTIPFIYLFLRFFFGFIKLLLIGLLKKLDEQNGFFRILL